MEPELEARIAKMEADVARDAERERQARIPRMQPDAPPANAVDSWITIRPNNTAELKTSHVDPGNGSATGFLAIMAEELNLSLAQVEHSVWDTNLLVNSGSTSGSNAIQNTGPNVRAADWPSGPYFRAFSLGTVVASSLASQAVQAPARVVVLRCARQWSRGLAEGGQDDEQDWADDRSRCSCHAGAGYGLGPREGVQQLSSARWSRGQRACTAPERLGRLASCVRALGHAGRYRRERLDEKGVSGFHGR